MVVKGKKGGQHAPLSLVPLKDGPKSGMAVFVCVLFPSYKDVGINVLFASFSKKDSVGW